MDRLVKAVVCSAVLVMAGGVWAQTSPRVSVCVKPDESVQWKTLMANPSSLSLDWPADATVATLSVDFGDGKTAAYDIPNEGQTSYEMAVVFPSGQVEERVLALTLTYKDADSGTIGLPLAARLGLVNGVAGQPTRCVPSEASSKWTKSEGASFVVPIPENATGLTVGSEPVSPLDPCGWHFVKGEAAQVVDLTLTEDGKAPQAVQVRFGGGGLVLILR